MKPSHYTTPRTLDECYFDPRGQAMELPEQHGKGFIGWLLRMIMPR